MSDTPRTDFNEESWKREYDNSREAGWPWIGFVVYSDFARQLERELAAANAQLRKLEAVLASNHGGEPIVLLQELDQARHETRQWINYATALETKGDSVINLFPQSSHSFDGAAAIWGNARKGRP